MSGTGDERKMIARFIRTLLSIGSIVFILYIFTFYIDGEIGIILIAFMLFAPFISLLFALYARKRIRVSFSCDAYVKKGSDLEVQVCVEKVGAFPLAVVEITAEATEVFGTAEKRFRLSLFRKDRKMFSYRVKASVGGNGEIGIGNVWSCGFLGFMKFRADIELPQPALVGVIPEIPDIKTSSQLFRSIADVVLTSDEEEEGDSSMLFSANTSPGYEHREYVPGDPIKRINWKLSSKKSKYMVRLDEAVATVQPVIALDLFRGEDQSPENAILAEEKLLCSVFGLLTLLVKQGISCNFVCYDSTGSVTTESVDNPDAPAQILLKVLAVKVIPGRRLALNEAVGQACACVVATTSASGSFSSVTDGLGTSENLSVIGLTPDEASFVDCPFWYLDENNNYKLV